MQSVGFIAVASIFEQTLSIQHDIIIFSSCHPPKLAFIGVGEGDERSGVNTLLDQYIITPALVEPSVLVILHVFVIQYRYKLPNLYAGLPPEFEPIQVYLPNLSDCVVDPEAERSNVAHGAL